MMEGLSFFFLKFLFNYLSDKVSSQTVLTLHKWLKKKLVSNLTANRLTYLGAAKKQDATP